MADETGIAWCDSTINLWIGCTKVSPACDNCYAEKLGRRFGVEWGAPPKRTGPASWDKIAAYQRGADRFRKAHGRPRRVFINSLSDFFDNQADPAWRLAACSAMELAPDVIFILVTKRPMLIAKMVPLHWIRDGGWPANVWMLTTAENHEEYVRRVPWLIALGGQPAVIGLSMEPLFEIPDLRHSISLSKRERAAWAAEMTKKPVSNGNELRWVIIGGESGRGARSMPSIDSISNMVMRFSHNTRVFIKQMSQADYPDNFKDPAVFPRGLRRREHP